MTIKQVTVILSEKGKANKKMINYFDFVVCISLAYAAAFIKEERIFKQVKAVSLIIVTLTVTGLSVYLLRQNHNTTIVFVKSFLISMSIISSVNIAFVVFDLWFFSVRKRNEKFNKMNSGSKMDTDLALKVMHISKDYLNTDCNVFDDGESTIEFSSVTELLNKNNIHSLENFISNIEYVKKIYNDADTYLNEYNYINKVLYNFYNNVDDVKYNKIKEHLK